MTASAQLTDIEWNGEPAQGRKVDVVVADDDRFPSYWARQWIGHVRPAVEIHYEGRTFYIDDQDDLGWRKVMAGGLARYGHKGLAVSDVRPRNT
jgi:hypothetical protein